MSDPRISEAEWEIMETVWARPGLSASEIFAEHSKGWALNTVRTLLDRLAAKKFVKVCRRGGVKTFEAAVPREKWVQREGESFLERVFGGAPAPMLLHFVKRSKLSAAEIDELSRMLDEMKKRRP